VQKDYSIMS